MYDMFIATIKANIPLSQYLFPSIQDDYRMYLLYAYKWIKLAPRLQLWNGAIAIEWLMQIQNRWVAYICEFLEPLTLGQEDLFSELVRDLDSIRSIAYYFPRTDRKPRLSAVTLPSLSKHATGNITRLYLPRHAAFLFSPSGLKPGNETPRRKDGLISRPNPRISKSWPS